MDDDAAWSRTPAPTTAATIQPGTAAMIAANRANWDARVPVHLTGYDLDGVRAGRDQLAAFEYAAMPVAGRDVVHLQCHLGTDTICLARHGARAVGLDLSGASIAAARELAAECGVDVEYVRADVHDALAALDGRRFDVVYTGKGALCWLPYLTAWARVVAGLLRPGGQLYLVELHPLMLAAADEQPGPHLVLDRDYLSGGGPDRVDDASTYGGAGAVVGATESFEWSHGLDEVFTALWTAGLVPTAFVEHPSAPWRRWPWLEPGRDIPDAPDVPDGWWAAPPDGPRWPLLYSLSATLPLDRA